MRSLGLIKVFYAMSNGAASPRAIKTRLNMRLSVRTSTAESRRERLRPQIAYEYSKPRRRPIAFRTRKKQVKVYAGNKRKTGNENGLTRNINYVSRSATIATPPPRPAVTERVTLIYNNNYYYNYHHRRHNYRRRLCYSCLRNNREERCIIATVCRGSQPASGFLNLQIYGRDFIASRILSNSQDSGAFRRGEVQERPESRIAGQHCGSEAGLSEDQTQQRQMQRTRRRSVQQQRRHADGGSERAATRP